jgi:hypothetical protein
VFLREDLIEKPLVAADLFGEGDRGPVNSLAVFVPAPKSRVPHGRPIPETELAAGSIGSYRSIRMEPSQEEALGNFMELPMEREFCKQQAVCVGVAVDHTRLAQDFRSNDLECLASMKPTVLPENRPKTRRRGGLAEFKVAGVAAMVGLKFVNSVGSGIAETALRERSRISAHVSRKVGSQAPPPGRL